MCGLSRIRSCEVAPAPSPLAVRALAALRALRLQPAPKEIDLYAAVTRAVQAAAPLVQREVTLWNMGDMSRKVGRIDYVISDQHLIYSVAHLVGIEVKAGVMDHGAVLEQLTRYSHALFELILVTEQGCRDLPAEINGMRVYQVVLSHLWGIAV